MADDWARWCPDCDADEANCMCDENAAGITAFSCEEAMMTARRALDAIREDAEHLTIHEETTMPILKQVGSIGVSRAR